MTRFHNFSASNKVSNMISATTFLSQNTEAIILCILFSLTICSCVYIYKLSYRAQNSIPILKSDQENWFYRYKRRSKDLLTYQKIKNNITRYQKYRFSGKNNSREKSDYNETGKNKTNSSLYEHTDLPFVSIIVPARNEEKQIKRCILSLLDQDYPNFEVIVINDNSTDATSTILKNILEYVNKNIISSQDTTTHTNTSKSRSTTDKLKLITLKDKPDGWTGKTWASQNGLLTSKGELLLFTDADTYYSNRDTILQAVSYMQDKKLDVLTGIPTSEKLTNFWSKVTIPAWDFISVLFGVGSVAEVNNSKSKFAYLMGSFFLIKKKALVNVGTFESVREEIQEDKALGIIIKKRGYRLRLVKLKNMVYTLWVDDLASLWNGIGRTVAPLVMKNKRKIMLNLLITFSSCILPFILLPFTLLNALQFLHAIFIPNINHESNSLGFYLTILSLAMCLFVFIFFSIKRSERGLPLIYSVGTPFGSGFVFVACVYTIAPLLLSSSTRPIIWRGRNIYKKRNMKDLIYSSK